MNENAWALIILYKTQFQLPGDEPNSRGHFGHDAGGIGASGFALKNGFSRYGVCLCPSPSYISLSLSLNLTENFDPFEE